jgi:hypothetical protein
MTRSAIKDLLFLVREREKVLKATAKAKKLDLLARFAEELAAIYAWDDDAVWKEIATALDEHQRQANAAVAVRATELGIRERFMPSLSWSWYGRGENALKERRAKLRKIAEARAQLLEATRAGLHTRSGANVIDFRTGQLLSVYGRGAARKAKFDARNIRELQLNIRAGDLDDRERKLDGREHEVTNFLEDRERRLGGELELRRLRAIWPF